MFGFHTETPPGFIVPAIRCVRKRQYGSVGTKPKYDTERNRWWQKISYTDHNEIKKRKTIYGGSEGECKQNTKDFQKRVEAGIDVSAGKMTVEQWLKKWLAAYKKPALEITSYVSYAHQVDYHIIPELGKISLKGLKRIQIQEFFNKKAEKLSPNSLELIKAVLVDALKMAVIDGYIIKSPAVSIKLPTVKGKEVMPLNKGEVGSLLRAAKGRCLL